MKNTCVNCGHWNHRTEKCGTRILDKIATDHYKAGICSCQIYEIYDEKGNWVLNFNGVIWSNKKDTNEMPVVS